MVFSLLFPEALLYCVVLYNSVFVVCMFVQYARCTSGYCTTFAFRRNHMKLACTLGRRVASLRGKRARHTHIL